VLDCALVELIGLGRAVLESLLFGRGESGDELAVDLVL